MVPPLRKNVKWYESGFDVIEMSGEIAMNPSKDSRLANVKPKRKRAKTRTCKISMKNKTPTMFSPAEKRKRKNKNKKKKRVSEEDKPYSCKHKQDHAQLFVKNYPNLLTFHPVSSRLRSRTRIVDYAEKEGGWDSEDANDNFHIDPTFHLLTSTSCKTNGKKRWESKWEHHPNKEELLVTCARNIVLELEAVMKDLVLAQINSKEGRGKPKTKSHVRDPIFTFYCTQRQGWVCSLKFCGKSYNFNTSVPGCVIRCGTMGQDTIVVNSERKWVKEHYIAQSQKDVNKNFHGRRVACYRTKAAAKTAILFSACLVAGRRCNWIRNLMKGEKTIAFRSSKHDNSWSATWIVYEFQDSLFFCNAKEDRS